MTDLRNIDVRALAAIRPYAGFGVVLADPPWHFAGNSAEKPGKGARKHYATMATKEIARIPVAPLCASDALLLIWATSPMLEHALLVLKAWGFRYVSQLVWPKNTLGTGYWARSQHEIVLIGKRGKFACPRPALFPTSLIPGKVREHSRKPDWLHEVIEDRHPDLPKLELFARATRPGWVALGNETDKFTAVT